LANKLIAYGAQVLFVSILKVKALTFGKP